MTRSIKFKKRLIFKRILFIIMLLLTFFAIFQFSSQDADESGSLSEAVTSKIVDIISKVKTLTPKDKLKYVNKLEPIIRKLAHFTMYTLVGIFVMGFFCTFDIRNIYKVLWSLGIGVTYAATDEIHQYFTPGRGPRLFDVGIDSLGVLTGIFFMILLIILVEDIVEWLKK